MTKREMVPRNSRPPSTIVADALAFTIEQMQRIDEAYLKAFPGRG
jgi:hypothetical protein